MKTDEKTKKYAAKSRKITLRDYYKSLPEPVIIAEKQKFVERIANLCDVSTATVRNWCQYGMRPQKQKYIEILVQETGIPEADLFAYIH